MKSTTCPIACVGERAVPGHCRRRYWLRRHAGSGPIVWGKGIRFPLAGQLRSGTQRELRHARGKWILWLDADDRLDDENRRQLETVLKSLGDELDAYAMKVRSVLDPQRSAFRLLDQVRLFRNLPSIRWDYRIHEQILPAVNRAGGVVRWADVIIDHVGYVDAAAGAKLDETFAAGAGLRRTRRGRLQFIQPGLDPVGPGEEGRITDASARGLGENQTVLLHAA